MLIPYYFGDNRLDIFRAQSAWSELVNALIDRLVEYECHVVGIIINADSVCRFVQYYLVDFGCQYESSNASLSGEVCSLSAYVNADLDNIVAVVDYNQFNRRYGLDSFHFNVELYDISHPLARLYTTYNWCQKWFDPNC